MPSAHHPPPAACGGSLPRPFLSWLYALQTIAKEIEEAVHTLLWASPRVSIPELMKLREQFVLRSKLDHPFDPVELHRAAAAAAAPTVDAVPPHHSDPTAARAGRYGKQVEDDSRADGAGRADVRRKLSHSPPADLELRRQARPHARRAPRRAVRRGGGPEPPPPARAVQDAGGGALDPVGGPSPGSAPRARAPRAPRAPAAGARPPVRRALPRHLCALLCRRGAAGIGQL